MNKDLLFTNRLVTITKLTEAEQEKYRKMKPGVYLLQDMIRTVAIKENEMRILEVTTEGMNRINLKIDKEEENAQ